MDKVKETVSSRHNRTKTNVRINSETVWVHRRPAQEPDRIPALRGGREHGLLHLTRKLFVIDPCCQRENLCSAWGVTGYIHDTPGQTRWREELINAKQTLWDFVCGGAVFVFLLYLFVLLFLCQYFHFVWGWGGLREKCCELGWVREMGKIWALEWGKHDQKILFMECF